MHVVHTHVVHARVLHAMERGKCTYFIVSSVLRYNTIFQIFIEYEKLRNIVYDMTRVTQYFIIFRALRST